MILMCFLANPNQSFNLLSPGRMELNFRCVIFKLIEVSDGMAEVSLVKYKSFVYQNGVNQMDDKVTLVVNLNLADFG